jgi:predicted nucleic acid-binding protein
VSLVLDCSATLAFVYQDEAGQDGAGPIVARIVDRLAAERAFVPSSWRLDVANGLATGVRRGRIDRAFRAAALADLAALDIVTDRETEAQAWSGTMALADRFGLTVYDAAYLELAVRLGLPLASLDRALVAAAGAAVVA